MKNSRVTKLAIAGLLVAVGIMIPIYSPVKVLIEPASFTLASHVVIFLAMFISPTMAVAVACGTAAGFFISGIFPPVVAARALSHVVYAGYGAYYLQHSKTSSSALKLRIFSLVIAFVHAFCEVIIGSIFYFGPYAVRTNSFMVAVILLVGVGTFVHSLVDFEITLLLRKPLLKQRALREIMK